MNVSLPNYELGRLLGEGSYAKVYQAKQRHTGKEVAVKMLNLSPWLSKADKQQCIARFNYETQLCRRLVHPNIVRLLETGQQHHQQIYAVFEYAAGETLKHHLAHSGSMPISQARKVMSQVLSALAFAHSKGVIHRDIKPANIILSHRGTGLHANVVDFGVSILATKLDAKQDDEHNSLNRTLGTPAYSAPEQLRGEVACAQTDLYAWGLVFLECLIGRPVISGATLQAVCRQQLSANPVPLPKVLVNTPLGHFIASTLHKNVRERVKNSHDVHQTLMQLDLTAYPDALESEPTVHPLVQQSTTLNTALNQTQCLHTLTATLHQSTLNIASLSPKSK